ncbi:hypothetical protein OAG68_01330 [bacterium]|nr:hypothetical protein [bacterium]
MKNLSLSIIVVFVFAATTLGKYQECDEQMPDKHQLAEFGLTLFYAGDKEPNQFLTETPCVAGISWKCSEETEEYFVGELHYPTENTADYDNRAPQYYMVSNIKIRKQKGLPIDLSNNQHALVLRDPSPETPLSTRGDDTIYELVGFVDVEAIGEGAGQVVQKSDYGFLFRNNAELRYTPGTDDQ